MKRKNPFLWIALFILIFLLSQDYLFMSWEGHVGTLGFPKWIAWFVFVHILFVGAFYFFAKNYWKE